MKRHIAWILVVFTVFIDGASAQMVRIPTAPYVPPVVVAPIRPSTDLNLNTPTLVVPPPPPAIHPYAGEIHVPHCDDDKRRQGSC